MITLPLRKVTLKSQLNMFIPTDLLCKLDDIANYNNAYRTDVIIYLLNYAIDELEK